MKAIRKGTGKIERERERVSNKWRGKKGWRKEQKNEEEVKNVKKQRKSRQN